MSSPMPGPIAGASVHIMEIGNIESMSLDIDSFATWMLENDPDPGDHHVTCYAWSEKPEWFRLADGVLVPATMEDAKRLDAEIEARLARLLAMSDTEALAEVRAEGGDPEAEAVRVREIVHAAIDTAATSKDAK